MRDSRVCSSCFSSFCIIKTPEAATSVYVSNACAVLLQSDSAIFSSHKEGNKSILCNILDNKANIFTIIFSFREVFVFYKKEFLLSLGSRTCIWTGLYFVLIGSEECLIPTIHPVGLLPLEGLPLVGRLT